MRNNLEKNPVASDNDGKEEKRKTSKDTTVLVQKTEHLERIRVLYRWALMQELMKCSECIPHE